MYKLYASLCTILWTVNKKMQKTVSLSERLKTGRGSRNWTQERLAQESGVSVRSISDYERNLVTSGPTLEQLEKIAKAMGVTIGWLVGESVAVNHGPDTETVRRILQALKSQADSMSEQITHYERKLLSCGNVEEAARHILQAAVKVVQGSKGGADDKHKPPGDRPTEGVQGEEGKSSIAPTRNQGQGS